MTESSDLTEPYVRQATVNDQQYLGMQTLEPTSPSKELSTEIIPIKRPKFDRKKFARSLTFDEDYYSSFYIISNFKIYLVQTCILFFIII